MMRIDDKVIGYTLDQFVFDDEYIFASGEACAIAHAKNMRVNGHGWLTKGSIQNHVGGFTPHTSQWL